MNGAIIVQGLSSRATLKATSVFSMRPRNEECSGTRQLEFSHKVLR